MAIARAFSMNSAESPCCADTNSAIPLNIAASRSPINILRNAEGVFLFRVVGRPPGGNEVAISGLAVTRSQSAI